MRLEVRCEQIRSGLEIGSLRRGSGGEVWQSTRSLLSSGSQCSSAARESGMLEQGQLWVSLGARVSERRRAVVCGELVVVVSEWWVGCVECGVRCVVVVVVEMFTYSLDCTVLVSLVYSD